MNRPLFHAASSCLAFFIGFGGTSYAFAATGRDAISAAIKAQVRDIVAGINTHNAAQATMHDAPNIIAVENGMPNTTGVAADMAGFKQAMTAEPSWHVSLVEETVDIPASGDMAVYRSIYNEDSAHGNVPLTHKVNFISGWSPHENGTWMMDWYVVLDMEKSHKK